MHISVLKLVYIHNVYSVTFSASNVTTFGGVKLCHLAIFRDVKLYHMAIFKDTKLCHVAIFRGCKIVPRGYLQGCKTVPCGHLQGYRINIVFYILEDGDMASENMSKFTAYTN